MTPLRTNGVGRLTRLALLSAIALTIFMAEAQLPAPVPIPGIKLGLANIVTVFTLYTFCPGDALLVLGVRIFLGSVFSGHMSTLLFSAGGGGLSWLVLCLLHRWLPLSQLWIASAAAALFHNLGQLLVAAAVMRTWAVMAYLPYLLLAGLGAGVFTGLCAQYLVNRLGHGKNK